VIRTTLLFIITAVAEIVGCYLPYLVLKGGRTPLLFIPAGFSLALFAWLLTLHPTAAGRVYAAYGAVYVSVALWWSWRGWQFLWVEVSGLEFGGIGAQLFTG